MLPRTPEPKTIQTVHIGTQPGAGTLEAGLRRLRVPSSEQNPGAGPLDISLGTRVLGAHEGGSEPCWGPSWPALLSGCPLLLLQLTYWTLESSLYVIALSFSDLQTVPKSLPVL